MTLNKIIQAETDRVVKIWNEMQAADHQTEKLFILQSAFLKARAEQAKECGKAVDRLTHRTNREWDMKVELIRQFEQFAAGLEEAAKEAKD